jgi:uncharacterized protein YqfB (UPF0267 family)
MKRIFYYLAGFACLSTTVIACKKDDNSTPDCSSLPALTATATDAGCGSATGNLQITATGGKAPLQYSLDGTSFQASNSFANLAAGDYTITVRDASGCESTTNAKINTSAAPTVTVNATNSGCDAATGGLQVTATGGSGTLQYSIDGTTFKSSGEFINLTAGDYTVTVRDASGCTATATKKIEVDPASISYATTIKTIISTNCAISGCHVAGTGRANFTDFDIIKARAGQIKTRTGNKSMPLGGSLTDAEIKQIACWVDAGAPNN